MKNKTNRSTFFLGLLIGGLIYLILWYWQKSTSAEDGALEMLDRLAVQQAELQQLRQQAAPAASLPVVNRSANRAVPPFLADTQATTEDDLTQIKGIGVVFAAKLRNVGLSTIAQVAAAEVAELAALLEIGEKRAAAISAEALRSRNP